MVPRRNHGPIVAVDLSDPANPIALSVQYTGWGADPRARRLPHLDRAANLDDFKQGLQFFDFGSQNWAYADVDGNIAYFTSGELPLREDLQTLETADGGIPPFLIRDGTHTLRHEWLPAGTTRRAGAGDPLPDPPLRGDAPDGQPDPGGTSPTPTTIRWGRATTTIRSTSAGTAAASSTSASATTGATGSAASSRCSRGS